MPVDKFGRMSDTKTKDTGVSLTYINNNYVRSDGGTPISGSLDMRGNTIYNVADPINPQDVATKNYTDNVKGGGWINRKQDGTYAIKRDLDIDGKRLLNIPPPVDDADAVNKIYTDTLYDETKRYVISVTPFINQQNQYAATNNINMKDFTLQNVGEPINDKDVATKRYVDNFDGGAFEVIKEGYKAKGHLYIGGNKIGGIKDPKNDGEVANKRYVDNYVEKYVNDYVEKFKDENDFFTLPWDIDMVGKKIISLPEPMQDDEPATKKYVDDLQTHYIDQKGNIKFNRNINVSNQRIFSLKEPKKPYEASNKKYVDDSITKRLQEEKDKFLPQDPATKQYVDEAIEGLAGGDVLVSKEGVFIKANGHYRATAPLDIDNQKMENLPDPVDEKDAVNKKYIDGIVENLTLKQGLVRENGGFNLVDSYINMNFNNIRNVGYPQHNEDAVPRSFVDEMVKTTLGQVQNQFKQLNQLVSISTTCHKNLVNNKYQFTFGTPILEEEIRDFYKYKGFLVPANGVIKHFSIYSTGLIHNLQLGKKIINYNELNKPLINTFGKKQNPTPIFSLIKIKDGCEEEKIGSIVYYITNITNVEGLIPGKDRPFFRGDPVFEFRPLQKYLNKEENFICSVNQGDIINIRSEYTENTTHPGDANKDEEFGFYINFTAEFTKTPVLQFIPSLHLATLTFLFKEMSFPNILELDPIDG